MAKLAYFVSSKLLVLWRKNFQQEYNVFTFIYGELHALQAVEMRE